jgi:proton glutamate symport protein
MKIPKIPLHTKIIIALVLGALFGSIFNVDPNEIEITHGKKSEVTIIQHWDKIVIEENSKKTEFGKEDQLQIISHFKKIKDKTEKDKTDLKVIISKKGKTYEYEGIEKITKVATIATVIKPAGTIFINLLSFLAIPLVIATLILGAASINDVKKLGRIGIKTFAIYIITTALAITIGLVIANLIEPGTYLDGDVKERLIGSYHSDQEANIEEHLELSIPDFLVSIVPRNPFHAIAEGRMLQIVFFAVIFGITLTLIDPKKAKPVTDFMEGVSQTMIKMVNFIMEIAPYGVFALIAATIADFGIGIITTLGWYIFAVILGLAIQTFIVYAILLKTVGRANPFSFYRNIKTAQIIGFSTSSSAATLPVTLDCLENKIGVPKHISSFVAPLGATINMDGTALYQGIATVFIAQVYGFDLGISQQLTIVFIAVLASIGTAPVPGVGIIMLIMILNSVGVPAEGIALIIGVDRILDMCRTITNVTGDAAVATSIAGSEKVLNQSS